MDKAIDVVGDITKILTEFALTKFTSQPSK